MVTDEELKNFIDQLTQWHSNKVQQLEQIVEHSDSDIVIDDQTIPANSDRAKGIRFGIQLSLRLMGKLPFSMTMNEDECDG